ncbi:hypothetical protein CHELA1G11_14164 [Hyphomicrobiales bacterium]|nr:hypothetical protein CHELA1G2_10150 [Hyphomicrobiales bacterium]CAH1676678.1 hypothetical protein CHELA1G11_14164 [Hyphomicrobiales bacterium]
MAAGQRSLALAVRFRVDAAIFGTGAFLAFMFTPAEENRCLMAGKAAFRFLGWPGICCL